MTIKANVSLLALNTLALPGRAEFFCRVASDDELAAALAHARTKKLRVTVLGGGSNVVLAGDISGLVIQMATRGIEQRQQGGASNTVHWTVAAGENWHQFVQHSLAEKSYGLENLSLIPGLVGAAPIQNIGAYGLEVSERFVSLRALEISTGKTLSFSNGDCQFGYRESIFKQGAAGQFVVTSVTMALSQQPNVDISYPALAAAFEHTAGRMPSPQQVGDAVCRIRQQKLPDPAVQPNAGSFFKNPVLEKDRWQQLQAQYPQLPGYPQADGSVKLPAAWLIDRAGWKGAQGQGCGVHREHALVLVNSAACSGRQLLQLAEDIIVDIKQRFGILLVMEPQVFGATK
ncbi:MAG: UDP-N-acetylmuramate dehydrogenase [Gammaproteobacteria bacterium]|nr:UDP-N-acetylmuramate dehydrogenase [Gammaproteobacteria bacterium]MBQ0840147.1 UDP-N-acetylmuramate dehydrogenase [Gammaproteobacteria bacterium]